MSSPRALFMIWLVPLLCFFSLTFLYHASVLSPFCKTPTAETIHSSHCLGYAIPLFNSFHWLCVFLCLAQTLLPSFCSALPHSYFYFCHVTLTLPETFPKCFALLNDTYSVFFFFCCPLQPRIPFQTTYIYHPFFRSFSKTCFFHKIFGICPRICLIII